jgi:hypothetical protein
MHQVPSDENRHCYEQKIHPNHGGFTARKVKARCQHLYNRQANGRKHRQFGLDTEDRRQQQADEAHQSGRHFSSPGQHFDDFFDGLEQFGAARHEVERSQ